MAEHAVLVVVVNYRSSQYLGPLLDGVLREPAVAEVVVRDNGSGADEEARLDALRERHPGVRFVLGGDNVGFGAGVNAAVREARSDWTDVWIVNPDVVVRAGALGRLLQVADEQDFPLASPFIVRRSPTGEDLIWFAGGRVDLDRGVSSHGGVGRPASGITWPWREVGFLTGAAPLVRRAAWELLGGFSERFFLYWEDADLSLRAEAAGLRMGVVGDAVVEHDEGGSSGGAFSATYCYYVQRNRLWLLPTLRARLRTAFVTGGGETRRLLLQPIRASRSIRPQLPAVRASLRGLVAGLRGPGRR